MYGYMAWPGTYSFKEEISLLLKYFKEQIDEVMRKIEQAEDQEVDSMRRSSKLPVDLGYVRPIKNSFFIGLLFLFNFSF